MSERLQAGKVVEGLIKKQSPVEQTLWDRIASGPPDIAKMVGVSPEVQPPYQNPDQQRQWEFDVIDVLANLGRS